MNSPNPTADLQDDMELLPLQDFSPERYNNFMLYFYRHMTSYRGKSYFTQFKQEHPVLEAELTNLFSDEIRTGAPTQRQNERLYEAYKIMRHYCISDRELFT